MTSLESIIIKAADLVLPSREEQAAARKLALFALKRTRLASRDIPQIRGIVLGGSYAKGTWLPRQADIDIFLRIAASTPASKFERIGLDVGSRALRGYPLGKKYAQHPYTEGIVQGVKVNIVPCYAVAKGHWKSAADRSPFHVRLVRRLPEEQKRQIRLLKRFLMAVGVYGAEIETQGFSGYVAEVLVLRNKTFLGVLRFFADFAPQDKDKLFSLPDPVDPSRDLGIAVSGEKLGRLVMASRAFLRRPDEGYFGAVTTNPRTSMRGRVVAVAFSHHILSEDILWGELRRSLKHIVSHAEDRGFIMARSLAVSNNSDSSAFLFIPEFESLPELEQRMGPTVNLGEETGKFLAHNRSRARLIWIDDGARVRLFQEREYTSFLSLLEDISRARAGSTGVSEDIARGMKRSARVISGKELSRYVAKAKWLKEGVDQIVSDTIGTGES